MKKKIKKRYKVLPYLLSLVIFICPLNVFAADSGSGGTDWNGDLLFHNNLIYIPLNHVYALNEHTTEDGDTVGKYKVSSYVGLTSNILTVTGTVGTYLTGNAQTSYTFTTDAYYQGDINVSLQNNTYDGLQITSKLSGHDSNRSVLSIYVTFDNFEITSAAMYFPIVMDISYTARFDEFYENPPAKVTITATGNDWVDNVFMYSSVTDLPGSKGFFARCYDGIKTHLTSLFNGLKSNLDTNFTAQMNNDNANTEDIIATLNNNAFSDRQQISNSSYSEMQNADKNSKAEINQSVTNTDNLMNGYDTLSNDNLNQSILDDTSEFSAFEDEAFNLGLLYMQDFSLPSELPTDILSAFSIVSSLMQSVFESSGMFGWIAVASFSFISIRMLFGLSKFMG